MSNQPCRYCGTELTRFEKLPDGKWRRYDKNGEHTYSMCKTLQQNKKIVSSSNQPNNQVQLGQPSTSKSQISNYIAGSSTFPVDKEPEIRGVTINSLFVKTSNMEKEIKELRKQIETLASIADSIAQKTELVIQKIGYPAPQPANLSQERARKEIEEAKPKKTDESGVLLKDGQEVKAVQRHLSVDEINREMENKAFASKQEVEFDCKGISAETGEVINPMRIPPAAEVMQWQNLSEAFLCHNCSGKFHNGYMKLGTKLCEGCKDEIVGNESEDEQQKDRSDVNNFNPNPPSSTRTVDDMMNEDL